MAKLSSDGKSVTVESGDTLGQIAVDYAGGYSNYKKLAAINNISNPNLIYVGQVIKLTSGSSGSGGTSSNSTVNSNKPTIDQFGLQSNADNTLFATWSWNNSYTDSYKVLWTYDTGNGVWFVGNNSSISVDEDSPGSARQSTYSIPNNARQVQFKVKPISKTKTQNNTETKYWEAEWSTVKTWTDSTPLETPGVPTVEIDKYKLTFSLSNIKVDATGIEFEVVKNNSAAPFKSGLKSTIVTGYASQTCTVDAGAEYKVRCRAYKGSSYSDWTEYSDNVGSIPSTPDTFKVCRANSETSVYLEWDTAASATSYDIEYTTKKEYFDGSDQTTTKTGIEFTHYEITGLESGEEYFFRLRSVNKDGYSGWSDVKSTVVGKKPAAPTTWSSTTTAITGEPLNLYWVHNSEDGSSQTYAELEMYIDGVKETHTIKNTTDEELKDKTSVFPIDTSTFIEGTKIQWRVRTAGITKTYGDWSTQRSIDIYAPATLELSMTDVNGNPVTMLTSFPFYISGIPGPRTQAPIGYHLTITSDDIYETTDAMGNSKTVSAGEQLYSSYFDVSQSLLVEMSAGNIDLQNNQSYTVTCVVSMNSGLTARSSLSFTVSWTDEQYVPSAEIGINEANLTAYIRPYCENRHLVLYQVIYNSGSYVKTGTKINSVYGELIPGTNTTTGEKVYFGTTEEGLDTFYCQVEEVTPITDVLLSVYRREFDGSFTELATGLDSTKYTTVTDPHPALDFARYRIVATSVTTGAVSYYDVQGHSVGCKSIIIQWDEAWSNFETSEDETLEQPPWSGSLLKLPYNIDVSDSNSSDVSLVEYIGRSHPVSYYGTQIGQTANWSTEVPKTDKETLYALRRLAKWMGDVYVREPSGSGYWANISVSFNQKHRELTIPVTLSIKRVEGGA